MKKIVLFLSVALLATACSKSESPVKDNSGKPDNSRPAVGAVVFSATGEVPAGITVAPASKTSISGSSVLWQQGDEISILWTGGSITAQASSAGATTTFAAEVGAADEYYAVYPSSAGASLNAGAVTLTIPAVQNGAFAQANIAVAKTAANEFAFKNVCSLGKITLSRTDIARVVFRGQAGENLAGDVSLGIDGSGIPSVSSTASPLDSIVLTPASGNAFAAGTYYFAAIPGTLSSGISFSLTTVSGNTILGKASSNAAALNRSAILNFGTLDASGSPTSITLKFDFMGTPLDGWPSGSVAANTLTDQDVIYPLDGTDYTFKLRFTPTSDTSNRGIYWNVGNATYGNRLIINGRFKYAGIPAIPEYKLVKVVFWQVRAGSSDKSAKPAVAIADAVAATVPANNSGMSLVSGGEGQAWDNGFTAKTLHGPYTYNLSGTSAGTTYYAVLYYTTEWACMNPAIGRIDVTYEKVTE